MTEENKDRLTLTLVLNKDQFQSLIEALEISEENATEDLTRLAAASFEEYSKMITENGMPNRADEAKQNRLLYLIEHYYENSIPPETDISKIFFITQSQSKTLLRNTLARYRYRLEESLKNTIKKVVDNCKQMDDENPNAGMTTNTTSEIIREELNKIILKMHPEYQGITRMPRRIGTFEIRFKSYEALLEYVNGSKSNE